MNTNRKLTPTQALQFALIYADIDRDELCRLSSRYDEGLYNFVVCTPCLKYEFYVDAANGEVVGINTEPLLCMETLNMLNGKDLFSCVA